MTKSEAFETVGETVESGGDEEYSAHYERYNWGDNSEGVFPGFFLFNAKEASVELNIGTAPFKYPVEATLLGIILPLSFVARRANTLLWWLLS